MPLSGAVVASLLVKIGADVRDLKRGMGQANKAVTGFGAGTAAAMSTVGASIQSAGANMASTGAQFDAVFGRKARAALGAIIKDATDFEASFKIMEAATLDLSKAMRQDLRQAAILVGADTQLVGVDAMQAAEAMTNFLKAGLSAADVFGGSGGLNQFLREGTNLSGAMRAAVDLQAASSLNLGQASDVIAIAMATFGIEAKDATKITDSFVQSADASVSEVNELAASMKTVGPIMASYGFTIGETNTALALLSERGIKGAEAGTAMKSAMGNMLRPTKKTVAALRDLDVALFDSEGKLRKMPAIFGDLGVALNGLPDEKKLRLIQDIFGSYGKVAGTVLLTEGAAGFAEMGAKIGGAATAAEVAEKRTEGLAGAMEQLQGAVQTFNIQAGGPLIKNVLTPLVKIFTKVIGKLATGNPLFLKIATVALIAAAAFGPLLMGLGSLITIVGTVISAGGAIVGAIGGIGAVVAGLAGPIIVVGALIAGLVLAIKTNFLGIGDLFEKAFDKVKKVWGEFTAFLQPGIDWLKKTIGGLFSGLFAEAPSGKSRGFMGITPGTELLKTTKEITAAADEGARAFANMAEDGSLVAASFWDVDESAKVLAEDGSLVSAAFWDIDEASKAVTEDGAAMGMALDGVSESWQTTWTDLAAIVGTGATEIKTSVAGMRDDVIADFSTMNQAVVGGSIVPDMVTGVLSWFGTLVSQGISLFAGLKTSILGILGGLAEEAYEKGKSLATRFGEGVKRALNKALSAARAIASAIRALLPGSDAETGPLSDLFASGKALPETLAKGMIAGMSPLTRQVNGMAANMRPGGANAPGSQLPGRTVTNHITITNPSAQTAERSISQTLRLLSVTGVL